MLPFLMSVVAFLMSLDVGLGIRDHLLGLFVKVDAVVCSHFDEHVVVAEGHFEQLRGISGMTVDGAFGICRFVERGLAGADVEEEGQ